MSPYQLRGPEFLALYLPILLGALGLALLLRWRLRGPGGEPGPRQLDLAPMEVALLSGGPARAFEAGVARLAAAGALEVDAFGGVLVPKGAAPTTASAVERATLEVVGPPPGRPIARVRSQVEPAVGIGEARLASLGLRPQGRAWRLVPGGLMAGAAAFGAGKIAVGLSRGRPVGILLVLVLAACLAALGLLALQPARSRLGDEALRRLRARHAALWRLGPHAPEAAAADVALAVALHGLASLAGSPLAHVGLALRPRRGVGQGGWGWDTSGCGSSSCGSSGCGGGGGGCGGCGS